MSKREIQHSENGFEEQGGYMAAKRAKLNNQFNDSIENGCESKIFSGVTININGHVNPTNLRAIFLQHGGRYEPFPTSSTDFIIAANLSDATKRKWGTKALRPEWVVQSIAKGEKLDHKNFFLYDFNEENKQKTLKQVLAGNSVVSSSESNDLAFISTTTSSSEEKIVSPKKGKRLNAWDDGFLEEFWDHSRLHNISTMKRTLQQHICKLRRSKESHRFTELERYKEELSSLMSYQSQDESTLNEEAVLFLVDLDCFFVSVGRINRPHMKDVPVVVTHFQGNKTISSNSDIACASYEARKFGVKNGMWVSQAKELCPDIQVIPYDFEAYQNVSMKFCNTIAALTLEIEPGSCDELLIDVSSLLKNTPGSSPCGLAAFLRKRIFAETQCKASIGIGANRLMAKLASKKAKPDGLFWIHKENLMGVLQTQPFADLPGIGYSLREKIETHFANVKTCGDLQQLRVEELKSICGAKKGSVIYNSCRGIDDSTLNFDSERPKSISIDVNYGIRLTDPWQLDKLLLNIAKALSTRAVEAEACGTKMTVTLLTQQKGAPEPKKSGGHGYVDVHNKSGQLINPTRNHLTLYKSITSLLRTITIPIHMYRGIGVHLTGLKFDFDGKKGVQQQTIASSFFRQQEISAITRRDDSVVENGLIQHPQDHQHQPQQPKKIVVANNNNEVSHPPPQETISKETVDINILASLPEDIANEIINFYKLETSIIKPLPSASNQPSTSHAAILEQQLLLGNAFQVSNQQRKKDSKIISVKLPSKNKISRIISSSSDQNPVEEERIVPIDEEENSVPMDEENSVPIDGENSAPNLSESFMEALPEEIRLELKDNLEEVNKRENIISNNNKNKILSTIKLPQVPHATKKNRETLEELILESSEDAVSVDEEEQDLEGFRAVPVLSETEEPNSIPFGRINWWRYNPHDKLPSEENPGGFTKVSTAAVPKSFEIPNLNEFTELADIKRTIREGVESIADPAREDLNGLIDYMEELIAGPFLKQTQLLLKFLHRFAQHPKTNMKWARILKIMVRICQNKIRRAFGFTLELNDIEDESTEN